MADKDQPKQEKTIGKEKAQAEESSNGAPTGDAVGEKVDDKAAEVTATYQRAKQELNEAVSKLRYEVSKLDVEQARQQARTWVEENPTLALFLALGAGIAAGRLLSEALKPAPPPPLSQRFKAQGRELASQARHYAEEVSDVVSDRAAEVGHEIIRRARELGEDVSRRTRELGKDVTRRAADTVSAVSDRAEAAGEEARERADHMTHALEEVAEEIATAVKERGGHGLGVGESLFNAAKTITAALVVKKVTDWLRRAS